MNTTNTAPEGLHSYTLALLDTLRQDAAQQVADDLQGILEAAQTSPAATPYGLPDEAPEWLRFALPYAVLPDGAVCWGSAKALLTLRTAQLIAGATTTDGLTGSLLASESGIDLYEFAGECWAHMKPTSIAPALSLKGGA